MRSSIQFVGCVGIRLLVVMVLIQPFCPAMLLRAEASAVAPPEYSDCHDSAPSSPAPPPEKKCCAVNHSQAAIPAMQPCLTTDSVLGLIVFSDPRTDRKSLPVSLPFDLARSSPILRI